MDVIGLMALAEITQEQLARIEADRLREKQVPEGLGPTTGEQIRQHHEADHFRRIPKPWTAETAKFVTNIKEQAELLHLMISTMTEGRERSIALTKLEESVMWAVKAATR